MSRESEKLYEAIGRVGDGQIEEAQGPRRRRSLRWIAPLAAVLAFAAALTVFLSGPGKGSAYAVAEAKYPKEYQEIRKILSEVDKSGEGIIRYDDFLDIMTQKMLERDPIEEMLIAQLDREECRKILFENL